MATVVIFGRSCCPTCCCITLYQRRVYSCDYHDQFLGFFIINAFQQVFVKLFDFISCPKLTNNAIQISLDLKVAGFPSFKDGCKCDGTGKSIYSYFETLISDLVRFMSVLVFQSLDISSLPLGSYSLSFTRCSNFMFFTNHLLVKTVRKKTLPRSTSELFDLSNDMKRMSSLPPCFRLNKTN